MIPHNRPTLGIEESKAVERVILSGNVAQGEEVRKFENEFCSFMGLPNGHAIVVSSGTSALFLALWVLNARNKKIIFPGYVCSALHHAVKMIGGEEVFIDTSPNSPNISINKINQSNADISIIPHMFGIPIDFNKLEKTIAIEDCCQALGAKIKGKLVGLQSKIGIFSFYATKLMTTGGQGGMLISKEKKIIEEVRNFLDCDAMRNNQQKFNFKMTDMQAAIGRVQLKKLPKFLARRQEIFSMYKNANIELVDIPEKDTLDIFPVRYRAIMKTKEPNKIVNHLNLHDIKAMIPMEGWIDESNFPNAFKLTKKYVSLPIYPTLDNRDVKKIISVINEVSN